MGIISSEAFLELRLKVHTRHVASEERGLTRPRLRAEAATPLIMFPQFGRGVDDSLSDTDLAEKVVDIEGTVAYA